MIRFSKKLSFILALGLSLLTVTSQAVCRAKSTTCRGSSCRKAVAVRTCRGSSCKKSTPTKSCSRKSTTTRSGGCCRRTTTTIIYSGKKKSGCRRPLVPGSYHYKFERFEHTNGLERISVPFPQRSRTR